MDEEAHESNWGFKRLTLENWTAPDVTKRFGLTEDKWLEEVHRARLSGSVPDEIRKMFEIARGSIAYGWFFYPLLTLASEQLYRIQEAAIRARAKSAGISLLKETKRGTAPKGFRDLLSDLRAAGLMPDHTQKAWEGSLKSRNLSSHPTSTTILPPGYAIAALEFTAQQISQLFDPNPDYHSHLGQNVRAVTRIGRKGASDLTVAGIDVGGEGKGFHCVLLKGAKLVEEFASPDAALVAERCVAAGASIVAVDAPCGWAGPGAKRREAEGQLAMRGYPCFSTPTRESARQVPFFAWMLNGERLYTALQRRYPLLKSPDQRAPFCFETFPFMAASVFAGRRLAAKDKELDRGAIVRAAGINLPPQASIDTIDAAVCALVAVAVANDNAGMLGNPEEGHIIHPGYLL